ncbi:hypothetical protein U1Q18_004767 [Sarracenia purpurea var. burkii]
MLGRFEPPLSNEFVASKVPKVCIAGSVLENIVFLITNSEGSIDETIHHDESSGESHMLMMKSESLDIDDSVRYSFCYGRCVVRVISLPQKEAIVHLVAAHSRYPELHLIIEVHLQAPNVEPVNIQPPHSDEKPYLLQDLSALRDPKVGYGDDNLHGKISAGNLLLIQDSSAPKDVEDIVVSIINDQKEFEEDILKYGSSVGYCERFLKMLDDRKLALEKEILMLQGSLGLDLSNHSVNLPGKEAIIELIESKGDSAAAVVCRLFRDIPLQEQHNKFMENIIGVVALLGTVQTNELGSVLAEYLGEDQMLAVVCKSFEAVDFLENCGQNRNADHTHALHSKATKLAQSINGRYVVICLEDTRPYAGELGSDPDRKLALPDPTLPSGNTPSGYLGYAVNMMSLDFHHLNTRTDAGYGLRETLFYCLFGELQVYETRENMKMAKAFIKHGAVSLDGGIVRGNGVLSLGHRYVLYIQ